MCKVVLFTISAGSISVVLHTLLLGNIDVVLDTLLRRDCIYNNVVYDVGGEIRVAHHWDSTMVRRVAHQWDSACCYTHRNGKGCDRVAGVISIQ